MLPVASGVPKGFQKPYRKTISKNVLLCLVPYGPYGPYGSIERGSRGVLGVLPVRGALLLSAALGNKLIDGFSYHRAHAASTTLLSLLELQLQQGFVLVAIDIKGMPLLHHSLGRGIGKYWWYQGDGEYYPYGEDGWYGLTRHCSSLLVWGRARGLLLVIRKERRTPA
jgi:hypothetical protein